MRDLLVYPGAATRFRSLAPGYVIVALSARVFTFWGRIRIFSVLKNLCVLRVKKKLRARRGSGRSPLLPKLCVLCLKKTSLFYKALDVCLQAF